jgi:hypothetical protein
MSTEDLEVTFNNGTYFNLPSTIGDIDLISESAFTGSDRGLHLWLENGRSIPERVTVGAGSTDALHQQLAPSEAAVWRLGGTLQGIDDLNQVRQASGTWTFHFRLVE